MDSLLLPLLRLLNPLLTLLPPARSACPPFAMIRRGPTDLHSTPGDLCLIWEMSMLKLIVSHGLTLFPKISTDSKHQKECMLLCLVQAFSMTVE
ncbi:hypothetical protein QKD39_gp54 [Psittacine adenovirus 1]|uniref:Uncharacterized protein n=1 Tax=Psittacine adenovirus 1 TaxID=318592 RepID=A0A2Z5E0A7_9ADEN|nr:hypothetical protein QKD39_gp54 [Psittacine adenovirus 1]AXB73029.1 hypothetical protein [Psittacine adenovirus 1]